MKKLYESDADFRLDVNTIPALAFVPPEKVPSAFQTLRRLKNADALLELLTYFEATYVGASLPNGIELAILFVKF
jgi:hypothetical protein